jgi:transcriptional/translational regulatory protein YebC/TACO1
MTDDRQKDDDYEYTRETLYDLIEKGREGIEEMIEVARQSEHPRAYEVLATLIKDTANTSEKLMDLHRKIQSIDKMMLPAPEQNSNTTNNLFIGSTSELQRMLKNLNDEEDVIDVTPDSRHDEVIGE